MREFESRRCRKLFCNELIPAKLCRQSFLNKRQRGRVLSLTASAVSFIFTSTIALISSGENALFSPLTLTWMYGLESLLTILYGTSFASFWTLLSLNLRPMRRFASYTVFSGFVVPWFFAASPIRRSPSVNATCEGVMRLPWSLAMISTFPFL